MKTTVVCGLLGSGKTTFIRNRLQNNSEKTVVLVNDFGKAGIDGEIFSADGIESVELPSGCVCCTLKFDLITSITKIVKEFSPEHLVIEPSGIASPVGVLEALESAGVKTYSVIGIVDVTEFVELYESGMYGRFFEDQVRNADVILVNKTDLAGEETILAAEKLVQSVNPGAILFRTKNAVLSAELPAAGHRSGIYSSGSHLAYETVSLRVGSGVELGRIEDLFDGLALGRFGLVARAKALVQTDAGPFRFDLASARVDAAVFPSAVADGRIVVIGRDLDRTALHAAAGSAFPGFTLDQGGRECGTPAAPV